MKIIVLVFCLLFSQCSFAQAKPSTDSYSSKRASFIVMIDSTKMTKEGIYLNGYVVHLSHHKIKALAGKTVRISGKVSVVDGVDNSSKGDIKQGRQVPTEHILRPHIKVLENR